MKKLLAVGLGAGLLVLAGATFAFAEADTEDVTVEVTGARSIALVSAEIDMVQVARNGNQTSTTTGDLIYSTDYGTDSAFGGSSTDDQITAKYDAAEPGMTLNVHADNVALDSSGACAGKTGACDGTAHPGTAAGSPSDLSTSDVAIITAIDGSESRVYGISDLTYYTTADYGADLGHHTWVVTYTIAATP